MSIDLTCATCSQKFRWTRKEQVDSAKAVSVDALLDGKSLNAPGQCPVCRAKRKCPDCLHLVKRHNERGCWANRSTPGGRVYRCDCRKNPK